MKRFKLKNKPKKPERRMETHYVSFSNGDTLDEVLARIPDEIDFDKIKFKEERTYDEYNDCSYSEFQMCYEQPQSIESFQQELDHYDKKLEEYNRWLERNKENVEKYYQKKEENSKQRRVKEVERMARDVEKAEKDLEKMKKALKKAEANS